MKLYRHLLELINFAPDFLLSHQMIVSNRLCRRANDTDVLVLVHKVYVSVK